MNKKIVMVTFLISLILWSSSLFIFYNLYHGQTISIPNDIQNDADEYKYKYDLAEEKKNETNREISSRRLEVFESLGGDRESLTRSDFVRLRQGGKTNNELLNSIPYDKELAVNQMDAPLSQHELTLMEKEQLNNAKVEFYHKLWIHGYALAMIILIHFIFYIIPNKRKSPQ